MKSFRLPWSVPCALTACVSLASVRAEDALPKAQPAAVYEPMAARSPFMAPTAPVTTTQAPAQSGPHWWDQMTVTSLMEIGGVYFAGVVDKANSKHYVLESGKPDEDSHLLLASVQWNERAEQSTIIVRKGLEVAPPLRFDPTAAPAVPVPSAPQPFSPTNPPHYQTPMANPPLPPGFTGTPPPPPPATSVVRRTGPIGSRPDATGNPAGSQPLQPPANPVQRRQIRPLSGNSDVNN